MNTRKKWLCQQRNRILLVVGVLLSVEGSVRILGMVDFPVYEANNQIGYIPAANQQGSFLNKNDYEFNSLHMGAPAFNPTPELDVLMVGDSVVYGGNQFRQSERLGPSLQKLMQERGGKVWPISAGSWALRNELIYLRKNSQVLDQVDWVVIVLNSADFGEASSWNCELTHPRTRPFLAVWYLFNKYLYAFEKCGDVPSELRVPTGNLAVELKAYLEKHGAKTTFFLYPDKAEAEDPALEADHFQEGEALLKEAGAATVIHLLTDSRWDSNLYKDEIHPNAEGNRTLAKIIYDKLQAL